MSRDETETERKYEGPALPTGLEGLPGVVTVRYAEPQVLDAVYYDTADLRLLDRGITVGGSDAGWHLKLPLGADTRQETHLPLALGHTAPAGPAASGSSGATRSAGEVVLHGLRTQYDRLLLLDGAVRRGDEDSVHRMRIIARRLRSLLKAHRRLFHTQRSTALADQLRWLARLLGEARDPEVLADLLVNSLNAVPAPMREGALRARITERYVRAYRGAWQRAVAELAGTRYCFPCGR